MPKTHIDLAISARWIVPIVPKHTVLENSTLLVNKGKIVDIALTVEAQKNYEATTWHSLDTHILMPGLINSHGHAAMSLLRGYADDLPLKPWLEKHIWPAEQKWVNETFVKDGSELAIAEMLLSGTTCFADMYFFPEITAKVALEAGIRTQLAFTIMDFPTPWASGPDECFDKGFALLDAYRSHDLIHIAFGPHAPYTVSDEVFTKVVNYAKEHQSPIQVHLHETAEEVNTSLNHYGMRPLERLAKLGVLSPRTQCVHMTQINDDDVKILQSSGAHVVHCPDSNLKLASGLCPVNRLLDAHIHVALGTDGAASNNDLSMLMEMQTAALMGKHATGDASSICAHMALEMATLNGAKALGIADTVGSLDVGKAADMIAINMAHIGMQPVHNPVNQLVYCAHNAHVEHVWVNGKQLVKHANLTTLNAKKIIAQAETWRKKMASKNQ